jgi:hypothetical protein
MQQELGLVIWAVNDPWARVISAQNSVWPIYHSTIHLQSFLEGQRALQITMQNECFQQIVCFHHELFHFPRANFLSLPGRKRAVSRVKIGWPANWQSWSNHTYHSKLLSLWFIRICVMVNIYIFFCHFFTVIFSCTGLPQLDICGHT